jgi:RNA polymerase sigma factor for flagellar operon FliA
MRSSTRLQREISFGPSQPRADAMTERDDTILSLLPLVRSLVRRISSTSRYDHSDMYSDGCLGAIRAVDTYDPTKGTLQNYAFTVIRGAIYNGIRGRDPVPERTRRTLRRAGKLYEQLSQERAAEPDDADLAALLPAYRHSKARAAIWSVCSFGPAGEPRTTKSTPDTVERLMSAIAVQRAINTLPERLKLVVTEHYVNDVPLRLLAERLHISTQRTSQLHRAALSMLRHRIACDPELSEARIA